MLLAKLALGFGGTMLVAGAYTFHEGVLRVDEDHVNGRCVHVWVPAAIVSIALHVVPKNQIQRAAGQAAPWLPTVRALSKELKKYPEADLVDVRESHQHVHIRTHDGRLLIDVDDTGEQVHVACPLAMIEDISNELEANAATL